MARRRNRMVSMATAGLVVAVTACSDDTGGSGAPTLPPISTTSTIAPSTSTNLVDQNRFYTVQLGDNLTGIAQRYGVTVEELMAKNGISNPDAIAVGQVLELPEHAVFATTTTPSVPPVSTAAP